MKKIIYTVIGIIITIITIPIIIFSINSVSYKDKEISTIVDFTSGSMGFNVPIDVDFYNAWKLDNPSVVYLFDGLDIFVLQQSEGQSFHYTDDDNNLVSFSLTEALVNSSTFSTIDNAKIYYIGKVETVSSGVKNLLDLIPLFIVIGLLGSGYFVFKKGDV